jgi:hypothetical protein
MSSSFAANISPPRFLIAALAALNARFFTSALTPASTRAAATAERPSGSIRAPISAIEAE